MSAIFFAQLPNNDHLKVKRLDNRDGSSVASVSLPHSQWIRNATSPAKSGLASLSGSAWDDTLSVFSVRPSSTLDQLTDQRPAGRFTVSVVGLRPWTYIA